MRESDEEQAILGCLSGLSGLPGLLGFGQNCALSFSRPPYRNL
jgi:hypothetical protein